MTVTKARAAQVRALVEAEAPSARPAYRPCTCNACLNDLDAPLWSARRGPDGELLVTGGSSAAVPASSSPPAATEAPETLGSQQQHNRRVTGVQEGLF